MLVLNEMVLVLDGVSRVRERARLDTIRCGDIREVLDVSDSCGLYLKAEMNFRTPN